MSLDNILSTFNNNFNKLSNILFSNDSIEIKNWYFKCFTIFSFFCGIRYIYNYLKHSHPLYFLRSKLTQFPKLNIDNFCVIIGFGDSDASMTLLEYLLELGYKLILLNNEKMINFRKNNIELQNILLKHTGRVFVYSNLEIGKIDLSQIIKSFKIDYIFDTSIYRHFLELNEKEEKNYELKFFHYDEITENLNEYYGIMEKFKEFHDDTNFYMFNYVDKYDDLNYKFLYDLKIGFLINFANVYKKKFIMKFIKLNNENKRNPFDKKDVRQIIIFSKDKDVEEHKLI